MKEKVRGILYACSHPEYLQPLEMGQPKPKGWASCAASAGAHWQGLELEVELRIGPGALIRDQWKSPTGPCTWHLVHVSRKPELEVKLDLEANHSATVYGQPTSEPLCHIAVPSSRSFSNTCRLKVNGRLPTSCSQLVRFQTTHTVSSLITLIA